MELKKGMKVTSTLGMGMFERGTIQKVYNKSILFLPDDTYYSECELAFNKIHGHTECIYKTPVASNAN